MNINRNSHSIFAQNGFFSDFLSLPTSTDLSELFALNFKLFFASLEFYLQKLSTVSLPLLGNQKSEYEDYVPQERFSCVHFMVNIPSCGEDSSNIPGVAFHFCFLYVSPSADDIKLLFTTLL